MNQTDNYKQEKLAAWSRRLTFPVLNALDNNFKNLLSGEFVARINPKAYQIPNEAVALLFCSDDRLNNLNLEKMFEGQREGKPIFPIRLPGAVVGQDIEKLKEKLSEYDFYKLAAASHADCGAAGTDQHAKDLVANLSGIENWSFISSKEDPKLDSFHPGSCLLVDVTGRRNYLSDNLLPDECLILNRAVYSDDDLAKSHITVLTAIALGDHGLGKLFSPKNPFYIFVAALNDISLRKYIDEAKDVSDNFPKDSVKVVGFLAPRVS